MRQQIARAAAKQLETLLRDIESLGGTPIDWEERVKEIQVFIRHMSCAYASMIEAEIDGDFVDADGIREVIESHCK